MLEYDPYRDHPILTAQEERDLAHAMRRGQEARQRYTDAPASQRRALRRQIQEGTDARERFITHNLRLVVTIAKRFPPGNLPFDDRVQEGTLGLLRAVERFDPTKGFRFSTYATWWIRQAIQRAILTSSRTVQLPVHIGDKLYSYHRALNVLAQQLHRAPTNDELAAQLAITLDQLELLQQLDQPELQLEPRRDDDGEASHYYLIPNDYLTDEAPSPEEQSLLSDRNDQLRELLHQLPVKERRILALRYGLDDDHQHTLNEVGRIFGISRERVRQLEMRALERLTALAKSAPQFQEAS